MIRTGKLPLAFALCLTAVSTVRAVGEPVPAARPTPLKSTAGKVGVIDHLELTSTDVRSVYRLLSEYAGIDIIVDPSVSGQVNAVIHEKNWQEVVTDLMQGLLDDKRFIMNTYYSLNRRQLEQFMQKLGEWFAKGGM